MLGYNLESSACDPLLSVDGIRRSIMVASTGYCSDVVKVIVSFYRTEEGSVCKRQRSRLPFDPSKKSNVAAIERQMTFLGLKELAFKFGLADFDLKLFSLQSISKGKGENYSIVAQQPWEIETQFVFITTKMKSLTFGFLLGNLRWSSELTLRLRYSGVCCNRKRTTTTTRKQQQTTKEKTSKQTYNSKFLRLRGGGWIA